MRCKVKECKKKLSLVEKSFSCKCQKHFCAMHRLPQSHNCQFDYQKEKLDLLKKQLKDANFKKIETV
jgi:predicted nucleic acid binding AN1-type Zn finger protein